MALFGRKWSNSRCRLIEVKRTSQLRAPKSENDPYRKSASAPRRGWPCPIPTVHRCQISTSSGGSDASRVGISVRGDVVDLATRNPDIH